MTFKLVVPLALIFSTTVSSYSYDTCIYKATAIL